MDDGRVNCFKLPPSSLQGSALESYSLPNEKILATSIEITSIGNFFSRIIYFLGESGDIYYLGKNISAT